MNFQSLFPLRSATVVPVPRPRAVRAVIAPRPVEFLMRWQETRRVGRMQSDSPLMRPSSLMRFGGRG